VRWRLYEKYNSKEREGGSGEVIMKLGKRGLRGGKLEGGGSEGFSFSQAGENNLIRQKEYGNNKNVVAKGIGSTI